MQAGEKLNKYQCILWTGLHLAKHNGREVQNRQSALNLDEGKKADALLS
jgi:hypothetical protein